MKSASLPKRDRFASNHSCLTLTVLVTTIDALQHFETG